MIHDLDEERVHEIRSFAKASNGSDEDEIRERLALAIYEDAVIAHQWREALEFADAIRRKTVGRSCTRSDVLIRELRDSDHRL